MYAAFPRSDYYGSSAPHQQHRLATSRSFIANDGRSYRSGSHVHFLPLTRLGAQLCPCSFAAVTPQAFTMASLPETSTGKGVLHDDSWMRATTQPKSVRLELVDLSLGALRHWFTLVTPSSFACRTHSI